MADADRIVEIIPPESNAEDSPATVARRMAKAAIASATAALEAAHRSAIASLDEVVDESLLGAAAEMSIDGTQEFRTFVEEVRDQAKSRMAARSLMLAEAFQRAAIVDVVSADQVVRHVRAAVARAPKDRDPV